MIDHEKLSALVEHIHDTLNDRPEPEVVFVLITATASRMQFTSNVPHLIAKRIIQLTLDDWDEYVPAATEEPPT